VPAPCQAPQNKREARFPSLKATPPAPGPPPRRTVGPEGAKHDPLHCLVQVSVLKDEQRALAAELARRGPQVVRGGERDGAAGRGAARERELRDAGVRAEGPGAGRRWFGWAKAGAGQKVSAESGQRQEAWGRAAGHSHLITSRAPGLLAPPLNPHPPTPNPQPPTPTPRGRG
jgi:hypothetical protein